MFLTNLTPSEMAIVETLLKWRALTLGRMKVYIEYQGGNSNFYKMISSLEKKGFLKSLIMRPSKEKFIFLTKNALQFFGAAQYEITSGDSVFHDLGASTIMHDLSKNNLFNRFVMEHEIQNEYPLLRLRPDGIIEGQKKESPFRLAIEHELNQKTKDRIIEKFKFYSENGLFNNIFYVFPIKRVMDSYLKVLDENKDFLDFNKFIFVFYPDIFQKDPKLYDSLTVHNNQETTLKKLLEKE